MNQKKFFMREVYRITAMILTIVLVLVIIIIFYLYVTSRRRSATSRREFMTGFWCASPVDCEAKGYRGAYLYLGPPIDDAQTSRAYIVALKGGRGHINCPFDFSATDSWSGNSLCGTMAVNGESHDISVDLDFLRGRMTWRDTFGNPLFVWEKNAHITNDLNSF